MPTDELLCALCLNELGGQARIINLDGRNVTGPIPANMLSWLFATLKTGAPLYLNDNPLCRVYAETLVYGTATCVGHIPALLSRHPRVFG